MQRGTFVRDGLRLSVARTGSGRPLIFQHGLGGDAGQPADVFPEHAGWQAVTLECRGHGQSEAGPADAFRIATFADGRKVETTIAALRICEDEAGNDLCPTGSVTHVNAQKGKTVVQRFDGSDVATIDTTTNYQTNLDLVTLLNRTGVHAIGLSGMDAAFLQARRVGEGQPGEVVAINTELLEMFLQKNYVPVVSPVGFLEDGSTLPLEPDQVAAELAAVSHASKLVYLVGVPGFTEDDELLGQLTTTTLKEKAARGVFNSNLTRKARWAISALEKGVERVHVIDSRTPHSIIAEFFTDQGIGSLVTHG